MNKNITLIVFVFASSLAQAQQGEWTWMHGDVAPNQAGNFGTQGVSSPTNNPPSVYEGCEWTDHNGIFWLFGGQHIGTNFFSDMWKYDPSTNEWTWMNGPGTLNQPAVYGTQGVSSPANNPGGRGWAPASWVDHNNNLWMFAGCDPGTNDMNNLWMYNTNTNEWTWMRGANFPGSAGSTGIMGVPSSTNDPSARHECTCSWVDINGDLWFFGGYGSGQRDDLWRYEVALNEWTWMKGDPMNANPAVYGTRGVPDPANTPGARNSYSRWADRQSGLWLFGGVYYAAGSFNDLWKFDITTNNWTWMKGPNVTDDAGNFGIQCVEDSSNNPPAHNEDRACWMDSCGNFWTCGGIHSTNNYDSKNDLWKYSPVTNNWTWVSGTNITDDPGSYGTIGVSAPSNLPPARMGSNAWQDINGNLWMGFGQTPTPGFYRDDLWKYVPDPACGGCSMIPVALFSAPNHICPGTCTDFVNLSQSASTFLWTFAGANPSTSIDANPTNICYNTPGSYSVTLIAGNSVTSDTLHLNNYITVYPYPPPQGITQNGDTLFANQGAVSYQWFYNGNLIPGATGYFYIAPQSGDYNIVATDGNGCQVEAAVFNVIASVQNAFDNLELEIYPNPANDNLFVSMNSSYGTITIYNLLAEPVILNSDIVFRKNQPAEINISGLTSGIYCLELTCNGKIYHRNFVKQ